MDNIIYYLEAHALGDEIHMHRNILLDLLDKNIITNQIVIYCLLDRKFLYSNIFDNVYCYEEVGDLDAIKVQCSAEFNKEFVILKNFDICFSIWEIWQKYHGFANTLNEEICITKPNILNFEKINYYNQGRYTESFKHLVTDIKYLEKIPRFERENYIVYHHRIKNDNLWDGDDQILEAILKYSNRYNIVIFSQKKININNEKIYSTTNPHEYVTFINNANCLAVISIWSGGGQIASYCSNAKLLMYFHPSQVQYNLSENQLNSYIRSENAFDFCQFTNVDRRFVNIEEIIFNLTDLI